MKFVGLRKRMALATGCLLLVTGCGDSEEPTNGNGTPDQEPKSINLGSMDTTIAPGQDFYRFANGRYLDMTEIPAAEKRWGVFNELRDEVVVRVREIIQESAKEDNPKGSPGQMVGDFYKAATDSAALEKAGAEPLRKALAEIDEIESKDQLGRVLGTLQRKGIRGPMSVAAGQDEKHSDQMIAQIYPSGMPLPEKSYYLADGDKAETRTEYVSHITKVMELAGMSPEEAAQTAETALRFETRLAEHALYPVEYRDPANTYHKVAFADLSEQVPQIDWEAYFSAVKLDRPDSLNFSIPAYFKNVGRMVDEVPLEDWKAYLSWMAAHDYSTHLNQAFAEQDFAFFEQHLNGIEEMKPRWKRVVEQMNWSLGMPIGKLYVEKHFPPAAKEKAMSMVEEILGVMKDRLAKLEWMSDDTRKQAIHKVETIMPKIGYPDKWRDYSGLEISPDNHLQNVVNLHAFNLDYRLAKIGKPVDRSEWGMPPQTVNAYYNPSKNEIVFPAGILQAPFFDLNFGLAENYGGFGAVIGHELIHAFDDTGSQYDAEGNYHNWWTDEDRANFEKRTARVVNQYTAYTVNDSLPLDGKLTLGENIADIDGLRIAFEAFQRARDDKNDPSADKAGGYTPEQRFFINYAQIWANKARPDYLRLKIRTDPHSPANWRVIGTLSNRPEFYDAFGIQDGDAMYIPDSARIEIW